MQCFDVATGNRIVLDEKGRAEIRAKALNDILPQLKSTGASEQVHAIRLCSALKAAEAIPDLKALMNDDSVQVPAAEALISITKTEAIPLIEPQLATANAATRDGLLNAIADLDGGLYRVTQMPDSPFLLETWRRLSRSQIAGVRSFAVKAVLTRDRSQYVHDHPELLKDPDQEFRYLAVRCLAERGDNRAIPLLRTAFQDGDSSVRAWALRGLAKYHPADILDILHRALQDEDRPIRFDAMLELAERGDKEAIGSLVQRIADLKDHKHDREGWCPGEMRVVGMCELVADLKLSAAEPALREAYTNKCEEIRRPVCGALAALGDRDALGQLHQFARSGEALDRASSIRMLALVRNRASLPVLQEALHDREPWVREAAEEAIARINHKSQTPPKSP
jgi:HEAT repeat protein